MKYLKKGLYIFIPLLFTLFVAKTYISTNNFSNNLEKILNYMKIRHIEKIIICKFFSFQINLKINAYSL